MCHRVRQACQRYLDDLARSRDEAYPWRYDKKLAERPIAFMERFLAPTKGDYGSMRLLPWECFFESQLYGWVDKRTGLRRYREGLLLVGRGNGKSTLLAGNACYGASKDGERGADVYLLANTRDQAGIIYREAQLQIQSSPALAPHFRPLRDGIHYDAANSLIQHRASDSRKLDGLNPHMAIFDELHEYRDYKLINVIRRGMTKRRQPLAIYISTMGTVLDGPLMEYYQLAGSMLDGQLRPEVADRMLALIYELDAADSVDDSAAWIKANPSMGVLLDEAQLREDWERAKLVPQERSNFINKQLNIFTLASDVAYVDYDVIERNDGVLDERELDGATCYGGYDLSASEDFTAACLLFPLADGRVYVKLHSWTTRKKVELDLEKIPYHEYAMQGWLTICEGEYITQDDVYRWIDSEVQAHHYEVRCIGYDPANASWLNQMLTARGYKCDVVRQGAITLNEPMKIVRQMLLDGAVVSNRNPMLRWYMSNVKLRRDAQEAEHENWVPTKRGKYRKIDGFMALLDAYTVYLRCEPPCDEMRPEPRLRVYEL